MIKDLETKESIQILRTNYIGHLGYIWQARPYIVPITYYFDEPNNAIVSYASEGHKIIAMRKNKDVSLEVNEIKSVNSWRSVLVHGTFEELQGIDAEYQLHQFAECVKDIIRRKEKKHLQFISEFSSKLDSEGYPIVCRIKMDDITAKVRVD
ncbi:MAG: pyridoxamine 5'-phosphate oxidase family protein [Flavobacteriaceae bacterium]